MDQFIEIQHLIDSKKTKEALRKLIQLRVKFPENIDLFSVHINLLLELDDINTAKQVAEEFIIKMPNSVIANFLYGLTLFFSNNVKEAIRFFKKSHEHSPSEFTYVMFLLASYLAIKDYKAMKTLISDHTSKYKLNDEEIDYLLVCYTHIEDTKIKEDIGKILEQFTSLDKPLSSSLIDSLLV